MKVLTDVKLAHSSYVLLDVASESGLIYPYGWDRQSTDGVPGCPLRLKHTVQQVASCFQEI